MKLKFYRWWNHICTTGPLLCLTLTSPMKEALLYQLHLGDVEIPPYKHRRLAVDMEESQLNSSRNSWFSVKSFKYYRGRQNIGRKGGRRSQIVNQERRAQSYKQNQLSKFKNQPRSTHKPIYCFANILRLYMSLCRCTHAESNWKMNVMSILPRWSSKLKIWVLGR